MTLPEKKSMNGSTESFGGVITKASGHEGKISVLDGESIVNRRHLNAFDIIVQDARWRGA